MSLAFLGAQRATFTTFSLPPAAWSVPGRRVDLPITELLPFHGGTVEIEVALYEADVEGPLHTAIDVVSGLASLMGPPLATAATVAEKISDGLEHGSVRQRRAAGARRAHYARGASPTAHPPRVATPARRPARAAPSPARTGRRRTPAHTRRPPPRRTVAPARTAQPATRQPQDGRTTATAHPRRTRRPRRR